ncbi:MAG: hypothetical protein LAQ69_48185 [Acidobacteriia bacterium]|nr:hypothetical protein [Terriglobia bacterium]
MRESIRQGFEWLSHIHTVVWVLELLGTGALVSIALATARSLQSPLLGFVISSLIICIALWLQRRGGGAKAVKPSSRDQNRDTFVHFIAGIEPSGEEPILVTDCPVPLSRHSKALPPDVTSLLLALGVIEISEKGSPKCVSASAEAFLASLRAHFLDGNDHYFGDWSALNEQPRLAAMLKQWEEYRIGVPNRSHRPSRRVKRALALIRADLAGQPRFIMLENPKWDPEGVWFVGGGPKFRDGGDLRNTVIRETCEELALQLSDLGPPHSRGTVQDLRISERIGLYTDCLYEVFALQIIRSKPGLLVLNGRVQTSERKEHFRWMSWDEILSCSHLLKHADTVLRLLTQIDPRSVPQSGDLREP